MQAAVDVLGVPAPVEGLPEVSPVCKGFHSSGHVVCTLWLIAGVPEPTATESGILEFMTEAALP